MGYVIAALALAFGALLVTGALTGRVKSRSCCSVADPMNDSRMRPYLLADEQLAAGATSPSEPVTPATGQ
jgi:hypothetical protein